MDRNWSPAGVHDTGDIEKVTSSKVKASENIFQKYIFITHYLVNAVAHEPPVDGDFYIQCYI